MQNISTKFLVAAFSRKTLVGTLVAVIVGANLALTSVPARNVDIAKRENVDAQLHAATSRFAFKLYDQLLKQRTSKNTFVSPASVMLALAMTHNGAEGRTRDGMARALEVEGMSADDVNRAFANLKSALSSLDSKIQLDIANSLWARNGFTLKPEFIERSKNYFDAQITSLDFADPAAADTINSWVSKNTQRKIEKIIERIDGDAVLFLINAIYFKGQWQIEFKKQNTKPDVFRLPGGEQKKVSMMAQSETYLYYKGKDFQSVVLPYGNGAVSMYVFLPDQQIDLDQFEHNLTSENWDMWMKSFRETPGDLMLPRFKVEWESDLNDELKALGMAEAFDSHLANFSRMAELNGNNLYISQVRHKTWAEVNEEGTVAAAATSVTVGVTSVQEPRERFSMKVDRPFFFAIRDNRTGVVLFMGSVANPG